MINVSVLVICYCLVGLVWLLSNVLLFGGTGLAVIERLIFCLKIPQFSSVQKTKKIIFQFLYFLINLIIKNQLRAKIRWFVFRFVAVCLLQIPKSVFLLRFLLTKLGVEIASVVYGYRHVNNSFMVFIIILFLYGANDVNWE